MYKKRDERIKCKNCKGTKFKISRSHGSKSHGVKVCKFCRSII